MSRRKGEMTPDAVDRDWPHQVALPDSMSRGGGYVTIHLFCADLSLCSRGHTVIHSDTNEYWHVYCFAVREHAEKFKAQFGGEWFDPSKRGRGKAWARWDR